MQTGGIAQRFVMMKEHVVSVGGPRDTDAMAARCDAIPLRHEFEQGGEGYAHTYRCGCMWTVACRFRVSAARV